MDSEQKFQGKGTWTSFIFEFDQDVTHGNGDWLFL